MNGRSIFLASGLLLAACSSSTGEPDAGPQGSPAGNGGKFDAIAADETVNYSGTEPFWNGSSAAGMATYATPDNPDGSEDQVSARDKIPRTISEKSTTAI